MYHFQLYIFVFNIFYSYSYIINAFNKKLININLQNSTMNRKKRRTEGA